MIDQEIMRFLELLKFWGENSARAVSFKIPQIPNDFHKDEAEWFLRAMDAGIVVVSDTGYCSFPGIHRHGTKPTEAFLFSSNTGKFSWREYITQVGSLARLEFEYGWPRLQLGLDPKDWKFDCAGFAAPESERMLLAVETKKSAKELRKTLKELELVSTMSSENKLYSPARKTDGLKKYQGLQKEKPLYLLMIAPGLKVALKLVYPHDDVVLLERIEVLPPYNIILAEGIANR